MTHLEIFETDGCFIWSIRLEFDRLEVEIRIVLASAIFPTKKKKFLHIFKRLMTGCFSYQGRNRQNNAILYEKAVVRNEPH